MNRREFIGSAMLGLAGTAVGEVCVGEGADATKHVGAKRRYALNPPTVKGYGLSLKEQVRIAIKAGFDGLEPWLKDVHAARADGSFGDVVKMARDGGLAFVNGIAFGAWVDEDPKKRAAGLEETKRDMAALAEMGCPCVAASMFGSQKPGAKIFTAETIAERYAAVCDLGKAMGVRPLLEYWGHSVNLHTPEDALKVAAMCGRDNAGILPDVYHTHRGGGSFAAFRFFSPATVPVLHMNDFPTDRPAAQLVDADRVWPGDGGAPWKQIFAYLDEAKVNPWLSIELFNPNYWKTTPLDTMKTALEKMGRLAN